MYSIFWFKNNQNTKWIFFTFCLLKNCTIIYVIIKTTKLIIYIKMLNHQSIFKDEVRVSYMIREVYYT